MRVPWFNIPLCPYVQPGKRARIPSDRIRPRDTLDLQQMVEELRGNTLTTLDLHGHPWSVVNVYSAYSTLAHVMTLDSSYSRVVLGPEEWAGVPPRSPLDATEGQLLTSVWTRILRWMRDLSETETVCLGYNWSPFSWGDKEEETGFQSMPTKWHTHIWAWPIAVGPDGEWGPSGAVEITMLAGPPTGWYSRLLEPPYGVLFGEIAGERIRNALSPTVRALFKGWEPFARGLQVQLKRPLQYLLSRDDFFPQILGVIAAELKRLLLELSSAFVPEYHWTEIERLLRLTALRPLNSGEIEYLRRLPRPPKELAVADTRLQKLIDAVQPYVLARRRYERATAAQRDQDMCYKPRCWRKCSATSLCWRKGFGYALVFSANKRGEAASMKVMLGAHVGDGGVVEAQGAIIDRSEAKALSTTQIAERSVRLWGLRLELDRSFYRTGGTKS